MRALITGASSGIGREIAIELASRGYDLILVARREERLNLLANQLKNVNCQIICADISKQEEVFKLYEKIRGDDLEIVVNNAGFGLFGEFSETNMQDELNMIDVNIKAVHILTKLCLIDLKKRNKGYILNVASSAGFMAGPLMTTYYATKNYVVRLTQAIDCELKQQNSNVKICALCPGPVDTEFNQIANVKFTVKALNSADVAKYAVNSMFNGKCIAIPGLSMKASTILSKLAPSKVVHRVVYNIQKAKNNN